MGDKLGAENAHIACQHHQIRCVGVDLHHQLTVKRFTAGKLIGRNGVGRNIGLTRTLQAERVGLVTEYRTDSGVNSLLRAGVDNCLQIASITGN